MLPWIEFVVYYVNWMWQPVVRTLAVLRPINFLGEDSDLSAYLGMGYGVTAFALFFGFLLTGCHLATLLMWHPDKVRASGAIEFLFVRKRDPDTGEEYLDLFSAVFAGALVILVFGAAGLVIAAVWPVLLLSVGLHLVYIVLQFAFTSFAIGDEPLPRMEGWRGLEMLAWLGNTGFALLFRHGFNLGRGKVAGDVADAVSRPAVGRRTKHGTVVAGKEE